MIKSTVVGLLLALSSCSVALQSDSTGVPGIEKEWELPFELEEVSGLTPTDQDHIVAMIQDEDAIIYWYDLQKKEVIHQSKFGKPGDFEGIEKVGEDYWVLKSNGTLYKVTAAGEENQSVEKFKTPLTEENDCEGLTYDHKRNILLIACKGNPQLEDEKHKKRRAIYAFDLKKEKLKKEPLIEIKLKELKEINNGYPMPFEPSAIGVNSQCTELYLTSSVGKSLITVDYEGKIKRIDFLMEGYFLQPEGIISSGDHFLISNEGKGAQPNLILYNNEE